MSRLLMLAIIMMLVMVVVVVMMEVVHWVVRLVDAKLEVAYKLWLIVGLVVLMVLKFVIAAMAGGGISCGIGGIIGDGSNVGGFSYGWCGIGGGIWCGSERGNGDDDGNLAILVVLVTVGCGVVYCIFLVVVAILLEMVMAVM